MSKQLDYQFKKVNVKQAQKLIKEFNGKENKEFQRLYHNVVYALDNGKAILYFDTHAFLYDSLEDIINYIKVLNEKRGQKFIVHILKDKLVYTSDFDKHEIELLAEAINTFKISTLTPSKDGVREIDNYINSNPEITVDKNIYSQALAYIGRVMQDNLPGSEWNIINREDDKSIFEPYIISKSKRYNPFFFIYRELYESLPEEHKVNLYDSMLAEIGK